MCMPGYRNHQVTSAFYQMKMCSIISLSITFLGVLHRREENTTTPCQLQLPRAKYFPEKQTNRLLHYRMGQRSCSITHSTKLLTTVVLRTMFYAHLASIRGEGSRVSGQIKGGLPRARGLCFTFSALTCRKPSQLRQLK